MDALSMIMALLGILAVPIGIGIWIYRAIRHKGKTWIGWGTALGGVVMAIVGVSIGVAMMPPPEREEVVRPTEPVEVVAFPTTAEAATTPAPEVTATATRTTTPMPTATPTPTLTPIPAGKSKGNPVPLGFTLRYRNTEMTVIGLSRSYEIGWHTPPEGKVYAVATVMIRNVGSPDKTESYVPSDFRIVGSKGVIYDDWLFEPDTGNLLGSQEIFGGATIEGDIVREVDEDDTGLVLIWSPGWGVSCYLALEH